MKKRILLLLPFIALYIASAYFSTLLGQVIICPDEPAPIEWPVGFNLNPVPLDNPQDPILDPILFGLPTGDIATLNFQDQLFGPFPTSCPILWTVVRTWTGINSVNGQPFECIQFFEFTDLTPPTVFCPPPTTVEWGANTNPNGCIAQDNGTGTIDLPPLNCPFVNAPPDPFLIVEGLPLGTTIQIQVELVPLALTSSGPGGGLGGEFHQFDAQMQLQMTGTGALAGFNRSIFMPMTGEMHSGPRTPGAPVQTFDTEMFQLQGNLFGDPDFNFLQIVAGSGFGLPSPGQTTLTQLPGGDFFMDSFFDITYQIDFQGAPGSILSGMSGSTQGTSKVEANDGTGKPNATDNCAPNPGLNFTDNVIITGNCPIAQIIERSWTASDACNNTSLPCVQIINVTDLTPPVISCPPPLTIEWGDPDQPPATGEPTTTDNCDPNPTLTPNDNVILTGTCPIARIIERTWTATDGCNNTSQSCVQIINVTDLTPPVFIAPGNTTLEWPDNFNLNPVPPGVPQDPSIDPSCLDVEDQFGPPISNWFLDLPAGQDVMQSTGEVAINLGSILDCNLPGQLELMLSGPVLVNRAAAADIALPSTAPCPAAANGQNDVIQTEIISMDLTGNVTGFGMVTLRVGAGNGAGPGAPLPPSKGHIVGQVPGDNTKACSFFDVFFEIELPGPLFLYNQEPLVIIDEIDRVPPQAQYVHLFPPGFCVGLFDSPVQGNGNFFASLVEAKHKTVPIPVTDNCDPLPQLTFQDVLTGPFLGNCATALWVVERTWIATDGCGNVSPPQVQLINMTDLTPPTVDCPPLPGGPLEWPTGFNLDPVAPNTSQHPIIDPGITGSPANIKDNCDPSPSVSYQDILTGPFPCPSPGQVVWRVTRTWTISDICGNTTPCVQIFEFIDTTPPVFTAPGNTTLEWPPNFNLLPVPPGVPQDPRIDPSCLPVEDQFGPPNPSWFLDLPAGQDVMQSNGTVGVNIGPVLNCALPGQNQINMSGPVLVNRGAAADLALPTAPCPAVLNGQNDVIPTEMVEMELTGGGFTLRAGAGNGIGPGAPLPASIGHIVGQIPGEPTLACSYFEIYFELQIPFPPFFLYNQQPLIVLDTIDRVPPQAIYVHLFPPGFCVGLFDTPIPGSGNLFASLVEAKHKTVPIPVTDNCDPLAAVTFKDVLLGPFPNNCPDLWVVERTWTAEDGCGNQSPPQTQLITLTDTTPPNVVCQNINVALTASSYLTITPSQVFDAINSSDNCGAVIPVSVSPSNFDCHDEGPNTVTLTGKDACGNTATCTATVTIAEFITNISASATAESCAGAGDGSITASATSGGGLVGYSIDGGVNFQFNGTFLNLNPGTYTVIFKVFGIPAICEETRIVTVEAGGPSTIWYKDIDDDGYSDGITQTACAQPSGYKAFGDLTGSEVDCDDNDPTVNIIQIWHKDADGDGYTDGTTQTSCLRPAGYKLASELIGALSDIDCNDNNPAVHPGATEVCNGIDDDCDGQIDEGASGGLTWVGNVSFTTQAQINAWSPCYSIIQGNVTILGSGINNLGPLSNLVEITGNLLIQTTNVTIMTGLEGLTTLGGSLTIFFNGQLASLNGLGNLATVGGAFYMYYNFKLNDCCAVYGLINSATPPSPIVVFFNKVGCNSVAEINTNCAPPPPLVAGPAAVTTDGQPMDVKEVTVFPNPTNGSFTVVIPSRFDEGKLLVLDITGRPVMSQSIAPGKTVYQFDKGNLPAGVYMVYVKPLGLPMQVIRLVVE